MNVWLLSDIHLEMGGFTPSPNVEADVVILSGDTAEGIKGVLWAKEKFDIPVVYVFGNHEYYHNSTPRLVAKAKEAAKGSNVHVLNREVLQIEDVYFLGCTLWTDMNLFGNVPIAEMSVKQYMNDFRLIRVDPQYRKFLPVDWLRYHKMDRNFIEQESARLAGEKIIIATHHGPSVLSIHDDYKNDETTAGYTSRLETLVEVSNAKYWLHGHTHFSFDYELGATRVICNPRGYAYEPTLLNKDFNPELIVEV